MKSKRSMGTGSGSGKRNCATSVARTSAASSATLSMCQRNKHLSRVSFEKLPGLPDSEWPQPLYSSLTGTKSFSGLWSRDGKKKRRSSKSKSTHSLDNAVGDRAAVCNEHFPQLFLQLLLPLKEEHERASQVQPAFTTPFFTPSLFTTEGAALSSPTTTGKGFLARISSMFVSACCVAKRESFRRLSLLTIVAAGKQAWASVERVAIQALDVISSYWSAG
eukprot:CAMPEP_0180568010 /NCGR_PEP_ID=MMETSP1037_2-20121125/6910_1 /TAXON_ID=632150 /ORGANISM="Azadinium spinosum, Strain 3D9" /LENGTH=219 /DNA_ID=CAMNT_0022585137 /DNA_START=124 /DNA_END=784 /DNA_ORIENTATION=-